MKTRKNVLGRWLRHGPYGCLVGDANPHSGHPEHVLPLIPKKTALKSRSHSGGAGIDIELEVNIGDMGANGANTDAEAGRVIYVWRTDDGGGSFSAPVTLLEGQYCDHPWLATGQGQAPSDSAYIPALYTGPLPSGGTKICLNTKLVSCQLTIARRIGNAWERPEQLDARQRAAFEILTDRPDGHAPVQV